MKFLIVLALLIAGIVAALAYLPAETTAQMGQKSAIVAIRGCKGAKQFVKRFSKEWQAGKEEEPAPDASAPTK